MHQGQFNRWLIELNIIRFCDVGRLVFQLNVQGTTIVLVDAAVYDSPPAQKSTINQIRKVCVDDSEFGSGPDWGEGTQLHYE